jgi:hypothetical protein
MARIRITQRSWGLFVALVCAGVGLSVTPARADVCGEFDEIAESLYGWWGDQFEGFFPINDEEICGPLTGKFQAACEKSVKDALKCWSKRSGEIAKAAKFPCALGGSKAPGCRANFKEEAELDIEDYEEQAESAVLDCQTAADDFFDFCMFP